MGDNEHLMYKSISNFDYVWRHFKLEPLEAIKPKYSTYMVESSLLKTSRPKSKKSKIRRVDIEQVQNGLESFQHSKKGKCRKKKSKLEYFNYRKKGYFPHD